MPDLARSTAEKPELAELLDKVPLLPAETAAEPQTTCVTGATSTIGAHVVRRLLRAGHTVHAPVRGSETTADVAYLKAMPGAERLKLFYGVDLLIDGSYDAAMVGCTSVHHVASPFYMTGSKKNIQNKLIDPAIKGTENVLASCSRTPTVKRVVVTGTVLVAACDFRKAIKQEWVVNEESWEGACSPTDFPYVYGKRCAEKRSMAVWKSTSELGYNNISSMARGARSLISTQVHGDRSGTEPVDARDAPRGRRVGPLRRVERPGHHAHVRKVHSRRALLAGLPPDGLPAARHP